MTESDCPKGGTGRCNNDCPHWIDNRCFPNRYGLSLDEVNVIIREHNFARIRPSRTELSLLEEAKRKSN